MFCPPVWLSIIYMSGLSRSFSKASNTSSMSLRCFLLMVKLYTSAFAIRGRFSFVKSRPSEIDFVTCTCLDVTNFSNAFFTLSCATAVVDSRQPSRVMIMNLCSMFFTLLYLLSVFFIVFSQVFDVFLDLFIDVFV